MLVLLGVVAAPIHAAHAVILYAVDFSAPTHTLGSAPATGTGPIPRDTPSLLQVFNDPTSAATVVSSFGALGDRPLEISAAGTGSAGLGGLNLHFDMDDPAIPGELTRFQADFDIIVDHVDQNQIAILFDAPSVHITRFLPNNQVRMFGRVGVDTQLGTWTSGDLMHVRMTYDTLSGEWSSQLNGGTVFTAVSDQTALRNIRIGSTTSLTTLAYIDNVLIQGFGVPEPATLLLLGLGIAGLAFAGRGERVTGERRVRESRVWRVGWRR